MKRNVIAKISLKVFTLIIVLTSLITQAQDDAKKIKRDYFGFAASLGTKSATLSSNYSAINRMKVQQEGGSAGVLWGSRGFQTRLSAGYYTSNDRVAHTTDLVQAELAINIYPLYIIQKKSYAVEPYFTAGICKNYYKFYGFYTNEQVNSNNNYSVTIEPYLGGVNNYNAVIGAGLEINLLDQYEFCKLFMDARYTCPVSEEQSHAFAQTSASAQLSINVGIAFGTNRFYKPNHFGR